MLSSRSSLKLFLLAVLTTSQATAFSALSDIDYIFSFGDSYTSDSYDPSKSLSPILGQSLSTASGGLNWVQYLAKDAGSPNVLYDLAAQGATTDNAIVNQGTIPSFVQQVQEFQTYFTPGSTTVNWGASNTLFAVWFGINDIGYSWIYNQAYENIVGSIETAYDAQISALYTTGARNFLLLNVPPTDLTPMIQAYGDATIALYKSRVALWNTWLSNYVSNFSTKYPEASVILYDVHSLFETIQANPSVYGIRYATTVCPSYSALTSSPPNVYFPECLAPESQYFWHNTYHPTFAVQLNIAQAVEKVLVSSTTSKRRLRKRRGERVESWSH
ncbi:hypothetical protein T439DRAFT_359767 [Meredithblackwellia eburnea MCA 4105]